MIVDDFDVRSPFRCPDKTDSPLLVDADAVLSLPIILQRFKSVARRYLQVVKNCRPIQLRKFAQGRSFDVHPALHAPTLKQGLGVLALEVSDRHG